MTLNFCIYIVNQGCIIDIFQIHIAFNFLKFSDIKFNIENTITEFIYACNLLQYIYVIKVQTHIQKITYTMQTLIHSNGTICTDARVALSQLACT